MGMAASQARLLSITSRMADNELRAQIINNSKMRLATESSKVSEEYVTALNSATMMISNYDTKGNSQYQKLSYNALTSYSSYNNQYALINTSGQILVSENEAKLYKDSNGDLNEYLRLHNLEYSSSYFTQETLGANEVPILSVNENNGAIYEIGTYTIDELKAIYEGYVDAAGNTKHLGYNNALQSAEYVNFSDLFNNFEIADDNYSLQTEEAIRKELFEKDAWKNIYTSYVTNSSDRSLSELKNTGIQYLKNELNKLKNEGKLTSNAGTDQPNTFYDDMMNSINNINFKNDNTVILSGTDIVTTVGDNIYLGGQYELPTGELESEIVATKGSNGKYTLQVNNKLASTLGEEGITIKFYDKANGTWVNSLSNLDNLENFRYSVVETGTDEDGSAFNEETIYDYSYKAGENVGTATWNAETSEVQSEVQNLFLSFKSGVVNAINRDEYANSSNASKLAKDAMKEFHDARTKLINFIFGNNAMDFDVNQAYNLSDVGWIMTNYPDKTSQEFEIIKDIYVLDALFDKFGEPAWGWIDTSNPEENAEAKVKWFTNLFNRMQQGHKVIENGLASSNEWIQFALESGLVSMAQVDKSNNWTSTIYSNISDITEVTDDVAVARAEAEYKKAMNNIENKDKRFDMELKNIDTEHNSLQTEYDSVKSVISKNIERSFKMYS